MKQISIGQTASTVPMIFKSYNLNKGIAEMLQVVEEGSPNKIYMPLTLAEFGLGMYGAQSWVHPTDLPPSHPDFVTWTIESEWKVTHNRTGELCFLLLNKEFHANGEFKLTPVRGGAAAFKTSTLHTYASAKKRLDELVGREISFKIRILSILLNGVVEGSLLLNNYIRDQKEVIIVFSSLQWMSLGAIPLRYLKTAEEVPSKQKRTKWKKKAKQKAVPKSQSSS